MTPKAKLKVSKFLSFILRHDPEAAGITLDEHGWVPVQDVLRALRNKFAGITPSVLNDIVTEDDKQRYAFSECFRLIRANQGHSIAVDLGLTAIEPPEYLYHGTARQTLWLIRRDGILPMQRDHVHLSDNMDTATAVGKRHGDPVIIGVRALEMHGSGRSFYRSENGVWLTGVVPVHYLDIE